MTAQAMLNWPCQVTNLPGVTQIVIFYHYIQNFIYKLETKIKHDIPYTNMKLHQEKIVFISTGITKRKYSKYWQQ